MLQGHAAHAFRFGMSEIRTRAHKLVALFTRKWDDTRVIVTSSVPQGRAASQQINTCASDGFYS